ncbi:MAG: tripartite tricarboxylate transporter permease [Geminicoccaceae bacterium]
MSIIAEVSTLLASGWVFILAGVLFGVVAGALPGFGASNTLIVLIPLTLALDVDQALILVAGVFVGVRFGGAIPAILINVPGTASGAATAFEGYPMSRKGLADQALGTALLASAVGSIASGFLALAAAPMIARVALKFSAPELFALSILSIAIVGQVAGRDVVKGWFAGAAGLLIGSIGADPMWGDERGTFGLLELFDGVPVIPALVGLYAVAEVMTAAERSLEIRLDRRLTARSTTARLRAVIDGCRFALRHPIDLFRSTAIGSFIGALPGAGANIASFLSYQQAVTFSPTQADREQFSRGNPRGIIASEAADNACASGALVPMMTLGIPGSSSSAVMLLLMTIHGVNVGPRLFTEEPVIAYAIIGAIPLAAVFLLIAGFVLILGATRLVEIPASILMPAVAVFSLAGAYAARYFLFDVYLALAFGMIGYVMKKEGFPPQAMLIGIILAPVVESNFFIGLRQGHGSPEIFFTRPISLGIWIFLIATTVYFSYKKRQRSTQLVPR